MAVPSRGRAEGAPPVDLDGYLQVDLVPWDQASVDDVDADGQPLNRTRIAVRRARLRADARRGAYHAQLELDGNTVDGPVARLVGAQVGWRGRAADVSLEATVGLQKLPFGREVPSPERERELLEPSTAARALFPGNYDASAQVMARWRGAEATVALANGAPVGDAQWRGRDPAASWELIGRVGGRGELRPGATLVGGVSLLTGQGVHPGTPATKEQLTWVDANEDGLVQTTELQVVPGAPATPAQAFDRWAVGADLAWTWCLRGLGPGGLAAEVVLANNLDRGLAYADPIAADRQLRELGWHVLLAQSVGRSARIAARLDSYRPDRDASEFQGAAVVPIDPRYRTLTIAGEGRHGDGRVIVQYEYAENPRGRGLDGAPRTRAEDRITIRAQVGF